MDYFKLSAGIALLLIFAWILLRNLPRKGGIHILLRFDTIVGVIAGLYLVFSSAKALF